MATKNPIPKNDRGLLAAQAKGGKAAADEYTQARQALEAQQRQAMAQAAAAAAARGAPAEAVASSLSPAEDIYNERTAALRQAAATRQRDVRQQDRRMANYNQAVLGARSLIGDQAALVAAPIRAQGEARVDELRQQGANRLQEIEMQMRADTARFRAQAEAARAEAARRARSAAKKGKSLSVTELRSALAADAPQLVESFLTDVEGAFQENMAKRERAAAISAKAAREYTADPRANTMSGGYPVPGILNPLGSAPRVAQIQETPGIGNPYADMGSLEKIRTDYTNALTGIRETSEQEDLLRKKRIAELARRSAAQAGGVPLFSQVGQPRLPFLNQAQIGDLSQGREDMFAALMGGEGGPARTMDDLNRAAGVYGSNATAAELMREGMWEAARRLRQQGYDITRPEVLNAMETGTTFGAGSTLADVMGRSAGFGDVGEQQDRAAAEQQAILDRIADAEDAAQEERDRIDAALEERAAEEKERRKEDERLSKEQAEAEEKRLEEEFQLNYGVSPGALGMSPYAAAAFAENYGGRIKQAQQVIAESGAAEERDIYEALLDADLNPRAPGEQGWADSRIITLLVKGTYTPPRDVGW